MVAALCEGDSTPANTPHSSFVYPDEASLWEKIEMVATKVYVAAEITGSSKVRDRLKELNEEGYGHLPV